MSPSFQLRLKHVSDDEIRRACDVLRPIVQAHGAAFILNDRPDLAAELGCDGVHVGQEDASYAEARAALPNGIVGVTCHDSRHLAMEAGEAGADYVAFGAFFPTATKEPKTQADIELLRWWARTWWCRWWRSAASRWPTRPPWSKRAPISWRWRRASGNMPTGPKPRSRAFNALFRRA